VIPPIVSFTTLAVSLADKTRRYQTKAPLRPKTPLELLPPSMATATAASSSSLTAPLLRPNPSTNPAPRSLPLLRFPSSPFALLFPPSLPALTRLHALLAGTGGAFAP